MDEKARKSIIAMWEKIGMPKSYLNTSEKNYKDTNSKDLPLLHKTISALSGWTPVDIGWMMYLYGEPNTQKTSWLAILVRELLKKQVDVRYVKMNQLLDLRKGGSTLTTKTYYDKAKLSSLQAIPILVIDDAFDIKTTFITSKGNFSQSFLYNFLKWRVENGLVTIIMANCSLSNISPKFGDDNLRHLIKDVSRVHGFKNEIPRDIRYQKILDKFK
jgi:DNA replication protein DnaC